MKRCVLVLACLLPWLAGCASFNPDPAIPPVPEVVGVAAQNLALKQKVREGHGGQPDVFEPLLEAQSALAAAQDQPKINTYAAGLLAQARAELKKAKKLWDAKAADSERSVWTLRKVATHAHTAKRLAQIAKYTARREIHLAKLGETSDQLHRLEVQQRRRASQVNQGAAMASASAQQLIGQKVVPGRFGAFRFHEGTPVLKPSSIQVVAQLAELLKQHPDVGVAILGYTSNSEPPDEALARFMKANPKLQKQNLTYEQKVYAYNLALSNARARTVARALVQAGIAPRRIGARGFGSSRPVASNATAEGRAANERVVAVIIPGPDSKNSPLR